MRKMRARQIVSLMSAVGLLTGFLYSQDLVELAKKEKERRAKAKDKKTVVITNADLKRVPAQPGIVVRRKAPEPREEESIVTRSGSPRATVTPQNNVDVKGEAENPGKPPAPSMQELEEKWRQANNALGAATFKLNSLWQLYYSGGGMMSIERIQAEIGLTHLHLQELQKEADRLKKELEAAQSAVKK